MNTKRMLMVIVILGIVFTTVGCRGTIKADEPVEIHLVLSDPSNNDPVSIPMDQIIKASMDSFQKLNPLITVKIDYLPKEKTDPKEIIKLLKGNDAVDIIPMDVSFLGEAEKEDVLLDLQPLYDSSKVDINQQIIDFTITNGKLLTLPYAALPIAVLYNKSLFEDAHIPYPQGDWTWEQFRDISQKLRLTSSSLIPYNLFIFDTLMASTGKALLSPNGNTSIEYLDSPEAGKAIEWLNAYYHDKKEILAPVTPYEAGSQFYKLQSGIFITGMDYYGYFKGVLGDKLGVASLPHFAGSKRANPLYIRGFGIAKKSKHSEAAWKFIHYLTLTNQENTNKLSDYYLTTSKSIAEAVGQNSDPVKKIFADEMNYAVKPASYYNPLLAMAWDEAFNSEFQKLITVDENNIPSKLNDLAQKLDQGLNRLENVEDQQTENASP